MELKKNEFQGELRKQREQLDRIQSSHSFQLENVHKLHQDEKARPTVSPLSSPACPCPSGCTLMSLHGGVSGLVQC